MAAADAAPYSMCPLYTAPQLAQSWLVLHESFVRARDIHMGRESFQCCAVCSPWGLQAMWQSRLTPKISHWQDIEPGEGDSLKSCGVVMKKRANDLAGMYNQQSRAIRDLRKASSPAPCWRQDHTYLSHPIKHTFNLLFKYHELPPCTTTRYNAPKNQEHLHLLQGKQGDEGTANALVLLREHLLFVMQTLWV